MCMKSEDCKLNERVNAIDGRVTKLECEVKELRNETRMGFSEIKQGICSLGTRMDSTVAVVVEEKARWGVTLRNVVLWTARTILALAAAAGGMTAYKLIFGN